MTPGELPIVNDDGDPGFKLPVAKSRDKIVMVLLSVLAVKTNNPLPKIRTSFGPSFVAQLLTSDSAPLFVSIL